MDFGDGNGGFAQDSNSITIPGTDSNNNANIMPGDFDNDGNIDLLVMVGGGYDDTTGARILPQQRRRGGVPSSAIDRGVGPPVEGLVVKGVGDYDLDGWLDLIGIQDKHAAGRLQERWPRRLHGEADAIRVSRRRR